MKFDPPYEIKEKYLTTLSLWLEFAPPIDVYKHLTVIIAFIISFLTNS